MRFCACVCVFFNIVFQQLSLQQGHKCLCFTLSLLTSIYRSEVTTIEVLKKLEILIPYLLHPISLPFCKQETILEFVSVFRGLLSACWTTQEDILNMKVMTKTGSESTVIDFIFGLEVESDFIRAYKVKSCITFNPVQTFYIYYILSHRRFLSINFIRFSRNPKKSLREQTKDCSQNLMHRIFNRLWCL
jgi:hypothetical protein